MCDEGAAVIYFRRVLLDVQNEIFTAGITCCLDWSKVTQFCRKGVQMKYGLALL